MEIRNRPRAICLVSVPHTGTIFTVSLFTRQGYDNRNCNAYPQSHDCLFYDHCLKDTQIRFALEMVRKGVPLVCPFRHPYLTEEAWRRRSGKEMGNLTLGYRNLMEHFAPLEPYWMPVDSPRRGEYLTAMVEGLNLPLETDWEPVHGYQNTHGMSWRDCDPSEDVQRLARSMEPLLNEFYGGD